MQGCVLLWSGTTAVAYATQKFKRYLIGTGTVICVNT